MALNLAIRTATVLLAITASAWAQAPTSGAPLASGQVMSAPKQVPQGVPPGTAGESPASASAPNTPSVPAAASSGNSSPKAERTKVARGGDEDTSEFVYDPTRPIPPGYVLRQRRRKGLIISGSIVFGVGYGLSLLGLDTSAHSKDFDNGWLAVPVVGPLIGMTTQRETCDVVYGSQPNCKKDFDTKFVLGTLFVMQAVGATLFSWGMLSKRQWLERQETPSVALLPSMVGKDGYGVVAWTRF